MTRWHIDDLLGRALEKFPDFQVLRYPAIAEDDEPHRKKGEALFPNLNRWSFFCHQKRVLTQASWESLYQQHPIIVGGGELPIEKLKVLLHLDRSQILGSVRYWDKGGSDDEDAAFTAGCLMHRLLDGTYVIEHIARGRWSALDRERWIKACAEPTAKPARVTRSGSSRNQVLAVESRRKIPSAISRESASCGQGHRQQTSACGAIRRSGAGGQRIPGRWRLGI